MAKTDLNAQELRDTLAYDSATGEFTWMRGPRRLVGAKAGTRVTRGYIMIRIGGVKRLAHRLAWLYHYGSMPSGQIDHVDGNTSNNAISNLRIVSEAGNHQNIRRARSDSASGLLGAWVDNERGGFYSRIVANGKRHFLGRFKTAEEAHASYVAAKRRLHSTCTI